MLGSVLGQARLNERSDAYYQWNGTRSVWYGRIFLWLGAHPAGDLRLVRAWSSADDELRCSINIRSSGRVAFQDRENRWIAESGIAIPTGRWVRIEWKVDHRKGRVKIMIFASARSSARPRSMRFGPRLDIGSNADQFQFGRSGSNDFPITFWTDSPALSTKRFLGPGNAALSRRAQRSSPRVRDPSSSPSRHRSAVRPRGGVRRAPASSRERPADVRARTNGTRPRRSEAP